ncbi:MAG: hypothetical protein WCR85_00025 [Sphaerochaeta sp.]
MKVTVNDMHKALQKGAESSSTHAIVGGESLPMPLLNLILMDIEVRVAPFAEQQGFDVGEMWMEMADIKAYVSLMAIVDKEEPMSTKDFGDVTYKDLKNAYHKAAENSEETFTLNGIEFFTKYAQYLIEYFEGIGVPDTMLMNRLVRPQEED